MTTPSTSSFPRGSEWRRWDLHVHTPASLGTGYGDRAAETTWNAYATALEALPGPIGGIGINDYWSIEGFRRLMEMKAKGRLAGVGALFPVVELRLSSFVGHALLQKLNFHVLFSNELSPDTIQQFFLDRLRLTVQLNGGAPWRGVVGDRAGMIALGNAIIEATPANMRTGQSPFEVGFANAVVPYETVEELLRDSVFAGKFLTAVGWAEWSQWRWEGAGAAMKRDAISKVDFLLTASPSLDEYALHRKKLQDGELNSRLIHSSDAHQWTTTPGNNRLGTSLTWIKADPTFEGLRTALSRFDERVFTGDLPEKLRHVASNATSYLDRLTIRRVPDSKLEEKWFDVDLPLNPGLVAIIGNQGSGKTALTDVISHCGGARTGQWGFLTSGKFCDPRTKKANSFQATLTWKNGVPSTLRLSDQRDPLAPERLRYVAQGFFDSVTNEVDLQPGRGFYAEIERAIFDHIPEADRLDTKSLGQLEELLGKSLDAKMRSHQDRIAETSERIALLEKEASLRNQQRLTRELAEIRAQLVALKTQAPIVPAPDAAVAQLQKDLEVAAQTLNEVAEKMATARLAHSSAVKKKAAAVRADAELRGVAERAQSEVRRAIASAMADGVEVGLSVVEILVDDLQLKKVVQETIDAEQAAAHQLDPSKETGVARALLLAQEAKARAEKSIAAINQSHAASMAAFESWRLEVERLEGVPQGANDQRSILGLNGEIERLRDAVTPELARLRSERRAEMVSLHKLLTEAAAIRSRLAQPVRDSLEAEAVTRERYQLSVSAQLEIVDLEDRFFALVVQNAGPFVQTRAGKEFRTRVMELDPGNSEAVIEFVEWVESKLLAPLREGDEDFPAESAMKKGATLSQLATLLFGLDFLRPRYDLTLNNKPLSKLSPGERGILLLVFYLLVDRTGLPLVIDQPEGNLNNQSIFQNLVPIFLQAKRRRQIIMVTHNPNLAVVCDAEQIVHCSLDVDDAMKLNYVSGAVEHSGFNRHALNLLEGTKPAFDVRRDAYHDSR